MYFFNTFKFATAAIFSILIAMAIGVEFAVSAGIVAILTIQPTKKETIQTALGRFVAFLVALAVAYICFNMFGYTMFAFFVYLVFFIFVCQILHWYNAMTLNSVLISHFLTHGSMNMETVANEAIIFCIGVAVGIIANLHLHKNIDYIEQLKETTDTQIKKILSRMSQRVMEQEMSDYNGECFGILWESIRKARNVAEENLKNQLGSGDTYDREYIKMRERQCQVLFEMHKTVKTIDTTPITAMKISEFLKEMAEVYHKDNTGKKLLKRFEEMDNSMKLEPLPVERKEFETRAKLYGLLRYMEEFIKIKIEFSDRYGLSKTGIYFKKN